MSSPQGAVENTQNIRRVHNTLPTKRHSWGRRSRGRVGAGFFVACFGLLFFF